MMEKGNISLREFNTSGICYPQKHYYVSRTEEIHKTLKGVESGKYFTLFASRQMGKTTFVHELVQHLDPQEYCPVVISFETMVDLSEEDFYQRFFQKLKESGVKELEDIRVFQNRHDFERFVKELQNNLKRKFVLIIDEFDGLSKDYLGGILHILREIYLEKNEKYNLHSLILIGVRNITDINMDNASPFNTNDEIPLPAFSKEQVFDLMHQYEEEASQNFAQEVKEAVYYNTQGQPGLTNALCKFLVEDYNPGAKQEIGMESFNEMLSFFIHGHISKNVANVINKAKQYKEQIIRIFDTQNKIEFNIDTDWIGYLYINGAITRDVVKSAGSTSEYIKFANPIYQKKIYNCFKPDILDEKPLYIAPDQSFKQYIYDDDSVNILGILKNYQNYVNQRGSKAFNYAPTRKDGRRVEAVYHYSLDAYLNSVAQAIGGASFVEFPTGNGKVDIFFVYKNNKYLIEIKSFSCLDQIEQAKEQVIRYAQSEGLNEAYLVIFTEVHPPDQRTVFTEETIDNTTIKSVLVNVNF